MNPNDSPGPRGEDINKPAAASVFICFRLCLSEFRFFCREMGLCSTTLQSLIKA
jgi:hypothetical protein